MRNSQRDRGVSVALGLSTGVAIGLIMNNLIFGIGIGLAVAIALNLVIQQRRR